MANKIIFWEKVINDATSDRKKFWQSVKNLGLKISKEKTELVNVDIMFIHKGDKKSLIDTDWDGESENYKENVSKIWKVIYGGGNTCQNKTDDTYEIEHINYGDLSKRLNYIIPRLQKEKITFELLEELIFDSDPELENLLKPFETLSPFEMNLQIVKDKNDNDISIKEALNRYISEKFSLPKT